MKTRYAPAEDRTGESRLFKAILIVVLLENIVVVKVFN